jgi:hypothetical protein
VRASNPAEGPAASLFVGIALPDARSARFVTSSCALSPVVSIAIPGNVPRTRAAPRGFSVDDPAFCGRGFTLNGFEPGRYTIFAALVRDDALRAGSFGSVGVLAIDTQDVIVRASRR